MKFRRSSEAEKKVFQIAIGVGFKKLRLRAGKSIAQISIDVAIPPHILERLEIGDYDLPLEEYLDLCECYGVKPSDFIDRLEVD